jgi:hypothetical protein
MLKGFSNSNSNFYNVTSDVGAIAGAVGALANLKAQQTALTNTILSRRTQLELAKSDLQKNIESTCGKAPIGCALDLLNLRNDCKNWDACRDEVVQYNRQKEADILKMQQELQQLEAMKLELDMQVANENRTLNAQESNDKKTRNWIIGGSIGVGVLIITTIIIYAIKNK